jgi:hypothetical protein
MSYGHALALAAASAAVGIAARQSGKTEAMEQEIKPKIIPDRVSIEQDSPFYWPEYAHLGVLLNGRDSGHVVEFCKSEGWARVCQRDRQGRMKRDSKGRPITVTLQTKVEPYWRETAASDVAVVAPVADNRPVEHTQSREVARRLRQQAAREAKAARRA